MRPCSSGGASVVAEVYTLHTALLAAILFSLMRWATTRSATAYYTAVACVAVSIGHHTTMVLLAPAFAAYVLLVDARYALRPRRLALVFAVLTLGLVPYAFIAVRTLQGAPFVETPIASFADGAAAVLSRRWQSSVFAFDMQTLLRERIPFVVMTACSRALVGRSDRCRRRRRLSPQDQPSVGRPPRRRRPAQSAVRPGV